MLWQCESHTCSIYLKILYPFELSKVYIADAHSGKQTKFKKQTLWITDDWSTRKLNINHLGNSRSTTCIHWPAPTTLYYRQGLQFQKCLGPWTQCRRAQFTNDRKKTLILCITHSTISVPNPWQSPGQALPGQAGQSGGFWSKQKVAQTLPTLLIYSHLQLKVGCWSETKPSLSW